MWQRVCPISPERRKDGETDFRHPPVQRVNGSFFIITVGVLDVKSLVEHDGES